MLGRVTAIDDAKKADKRRMKVIGKRIAKLRNKRNLSLEDLTALARVKYAALYTYEHGDRIPSVFSAMRIAEVLHTTVEKLFAPESDADKEAA